MKLFEHQETDKTLDRLPALPPGVQVPDDISGLEPPTTKRTTGGVRWMRWLTAVVLLGGAGVLTAVLLSNDADETPVDYLETYGTDNPVILDEAAEPGTVEIVATEDFMALYGTDNPVFIMDAGSYADHIRALYGTGTLVVIPEANGLAGSYTEHVMALTGTDPGDYMALYGTDNPVFLPEPTSMELYGTDNPVFIP